MVNSRLRSLERKLVLERAEVQVEALVIQLVQKWEWYAYEARPLPDPMEFIDQLFDAGFYLRSNLKAISYLEECKRDGKVPEERRLCQILLPWYR